MWHTPSMQPAIVTYLITLLFSIVMAAMLSTAAWSRRESPGAIPFALAMVMVMLASTNRTMFLLADPENAYLWARLRIVFLSFIPPFATVFVLDYIGFSRWARASRSWPLFVVPLILSILLWTHDGLFFTSWGLTEETGIRTEVQVYGPLWRVNLIYGYGCFIAILGMLLRSMLTSLRPMRSQTLLLIIGWTIMVGSNMPFAILSLGRYIPNLTNVGFVIAGVFFLAALRRQGFLDRVPLALQAVYQSMQDGVIVFDAKHRISAMNPAAERYIGASSSDLVGKVSQEAFAARPDLIERFRGVSELHHVEVTDKDRVFDFDMSPILNQGEHAGNVLVIRDITERRIAEERALVLRLEKERIHLLAGVIRDTSNELRAPLTMISSSVYAAQNAASPQQRKEKLAQIEVSTSHMTQIIDTLQLLADLDVRTTLSLSEFTVRDWLETLPNAVRELIDRRSHRLIREFDKSNPVTLYADFYLLRSALQQLLLNAALYTPEGGLITLKAAQVEDTIEVTVSDNGGGIAPEALEAIFDRFTKLNRTRMQDGSGAGIGLAIVKKVVELHDGTGGAHSVLGKGSDFTMRIPLRAKVVAPTEQGAASG